MRIPVSLCRAPAGTGGTRPEQDVVVVTDADATAEGLRKVLSAHLGTAVTAQLWTERAPVAGTARLTDSLRAGDRVGLGGPPDPLPVVGVHRVLKVVAGPDAGALLPLPDHGAVTLGRRSSSTLPLRDPDTSRDHARVDCTPRHLTLHDLGSANGTTVDGVPVAGPTPLVPGALVRIGDNELQVDAGRVPDGRVVPVDGGLRLDREPRHVEPARRTTVTLPTGPGEPDLPSAAWGAITAVGGVVMGVAGAVLWHNLVLLVFAGVGALVAVGGNYVQRRHALHRWRRDSAVRKAEREREHERARRAVERETLRRRAASEGPADVLLTALGPGARLWQRLPADHDMATVRVGTADQPSHDVEVRDLGAGGREEACVVRAVPATVDLRASGTLGLRGAPHDVRGLARWVLAQLVCQAGPAHLQVVVLTDPADGDAAAAWDWVRWLPHARPRRGPLARVGTTAATLHQRVRELDDLVTRRAAGTAAAPLVVVVVDGVDPHAVPHLTSVLENGPGVGVPAVVCRALPAACPAQVVLDGAGHARLLRAGEDELAGVRVETVGTAWAQRLGRALAPLVDPLDAEETGLPATVSLQDTLGDLADPGVAAASWAARPRSSRAVLGRTADGPCVLDLAADGPHVLVGGRTGFGKSVVMQSLVLALAAVNRPDELTFVLVDYKGGNAFGPLRGLPHVVGEFTNLDPAWAVGRALDSLAAEIERRQRHLADADVERLEQYQALADAGALAPGSPRRMPRLVVVIDEYRALARVLPDSVVDRLVQVATQGRAYGVHLVIGDQDPEQTVPLAVRNQIGAVLAVALKEPTSRALLGSSAAVGLPRGQALLHRAGDPTSTPFRAAFGAAGRSDAAGRVEVVAADWGVLGTVPDESRPADELGEIANRAVTELAARLAAARTRAGIDAPEPPWLPRLPDALPLTAVLARAPVPAGEVVLGVADHVRERAQPTVTWTPARGNLLVTGRAGSGRTSLLRTLAASAALTARPGELHLYAIDAGGGGLAGLAALPHTAAVATVRDPEHVDRILSRLHRLVERPQGGPRVLLLVDGWEGWQRSLAALDDGAYSRRLVALMQQGPAAGVAVAVTGSPSLLSAGGHAAAMAETAETVLVLPSTDDGYVAARIDRAHRPVDPAPGRAVRQRDGGPVQVAVLAPGSAPPADPPDGAQQDAELARIAARPAAVHEASGPVELAPLPSVLTLGEAPPAEADDQWAVPVGVGGDPLRLRALDLQRRGHSAVVAGGRGSGRSTALAVAVAATRGLAVVLWAPVAGSRLLEMAGHPAVCAVLTGIAVTRRDLLLAWACAQTAPALLVVDDAEQLAGAPAAATLTELARAGRGSGLALLLASTFDGLSGAVPHLHEAAAADVLALTPPPGVHTSRGFLRPPAAAVGGQPGRGVLLSGDGATVVQVPVPPWRPDPGRVEADRALRATANALLGDDVDLAEMREAVSAARAEARTAG